MKAGLIGAATAALVLSGCYYPGPYVYYPPVPAQQAGVETIPPNSPDYPQPGTAQTPPGANAPQGAPGQAQGQPPQQAQAPNAPQPGYNGGPVYYGYPAYGVPAYGYPAYGYPAYGYPAYPVYGAPVIGFGLSFGGHWR